MIIRDGTISRNRSPTSKENSRAEEVSASILSRRLHSRTNCLGSSQRVHRMLHTKSTANEIGLHGAISERLNNFATFDTYWIIVRSLVSCSRNRIGYRWIKIEQFCTVDSSVLFLGRAVH